MLVGKTGAQCREVTDFSKTRPGDIVLSFTDGKLSHVGILIEYHPAYTIQPNPDYPPLHFHPEFVTCDGNLGGTNGKPGGTVTWDLIHGLSDDFSEIGTRYHIFTRYPD